MSGEILCMRSHTIRPKLEQLEGRWVPATIRLVAGNLFISHQAGPLVVESTAVAGQFKITDSAKTVIVNGVGSLISITGTNLADKITFQANVAGGNKAFPGNLLINSGNGADLIDLSGRVSGNVTLLTGLGNDTVTSTSEDVSVGGNLTWSDPTGVNTFNLNSLNYTIGNNLTLFGVGNFSMGQSNILKVGGFASLTATQTSANPMSVLFDGAAVSIGKSLQLTGGTLNDSFSVTSELTVGNMLWANLGNGDNVVNLSPAAGGGGIGGNFFYTGGGGKDVVGFGVNSSVAGNTQLSLGEGINAFIDSSTSLYSGDLSIQGGNDTNTTVVSGLVSGNVNIDLGNGDSNTTTVTGSVGGTFRYRLGNGSLGVLNLLPTVAQTLSVDILFGTGDSTFTLSPNLTLDGIVRGTGGTYTFNQGTAILAPNLIFFNYPV